MNDESGIPRYRREFAEFGLLDIVIPEGFEDVSWHNDSCPSFACDALGVYLFVDYADRSMSDFPKNKRFSLVRGEVEDGVMVHADAGEDATLAHTDDFQEVLAVISARRQEISLRRLSPFAL